MRHRATLCGAAMVLLPLVVTLDPALSAPLEPLPGAETAFRTRCRQAYLAQGRSAARWADGQCGQDWQAVVATGPAAAALIAALPAPAERPALAAVRARMPGVRWRPRPEAGTLASGALGPVQVRIEGRGVPTAAGIAWGAVGEPIPHDMAGALIARGATLTLRSCEMLGAGEGTRRFAGSIAGRAPFTLVIEQRTAPTGDAQSYYAATVSLDGRQPQAGPTTPCDIR